MPNTPKVEPEKRRIIFRQKALSPQKSEADLMLTLNELLQKAGIPAYTRFSRSAIKRDGGGYLTYSMGQRCGTTVFEFNFT